MTRIPAVAELPCIAAFWELQLLAAPVNKELLDAAKPLAGRDCLSPACLLNLIIVSGFSFLPSGSDNRLWEGELQQGALAGVNPPSPGLQVEIVSVMLIVVLIPSPRTLRF